MLTEAKQLYLELHVHSMMQTKYTARTSDMDCSERDHLSETVGKQPQVLRVMCTDVGLPK